MKKVRGGKRLSLLPVTAEILLFSALMN